MRVGVLIPLLILGACQFDASVQGAAVRCSAESQCPPGTTCVAGACESLLRPITSVGVSPARARAGDTVTLTIKTDRAIRSARATLELQGQRFSFEGPRRLQDGLEFTLQVSGREPSGRGTVRLWLVDSAGDSFPNLIVGEVTLDFEGPSLVAPRLRLVPRDDNALVQLGASAALTGATDGTVVRFTFALDDEVLSPPQVLATHLGDGGTQALRQALDSDGPGRYAYEAEVSSGWPEGDYALTVAATDVLANGATRAAGQLNVDRSPPAAPRVEAPLGMVYRRAPYGAAAHPGVPRFTLRGQPGSTDGVGAVAVYAQGIPVGRALSDADGGVAEFGLNIAGDQPQLEVGFIDGAGNASPLVTVLDTEWVGWFGPGLAQSPANTVVPQAVAEERLLDDRAAPAPARDWPLTVTGGVRTVGRGPWPRAEAGECTYLPATGRTAGLVWSPDGQASALAGAVLVDDGLVAVPLVPRTDTSAVSLASRPTWDSARDVVVLLGRSAGAAQLETFLAPPRGPDAGLGELTKVSSDAGPAALTNMAVAFDEARGETVLFGGTLADGGLLAETWLLNASGWRQAAADAGHPSARAAAALAYDSDRERVVLFGGRAGGAVFGDTWEWDGVAWAPRPARATTGRTNASLTYEVARRRLLLGGGFEVADSGVESYQQAPRILTEGASEWKPFPQRTNGRWSSRPFCHDPMRRLSFGYGGSYVDCVDLGEGNSECTEYFNALTAFDDGTTLTEESLAGPGALTEGVLACTPQGPLLFAGRTALGSSAALWRFDDTARVWNAQATTGTAPSGPGVQAGWSESEQAVVALQGSTLFRLKNGAWTSAPLVGAAGTLFEYAQGVALLSNQGGKALVAQLAGTSAAPLLGVPSFGAALVAGDRGSSRFLLWGKSPEASSVRLFSGLVAQPYDAPGPDGDSLLAQWVPSLERVTQYRGAITDLELDGRARPALVLSFDLLGAAIPKGSRWVRLEVAASASASSSTPAGPSGELQLEAFRSGRWVSGLFAPSQPSGAFRGSAVDSVTLARLLDGRKALRLRVSPVGTNGAGRAEVTVEHLEVVLSYRRSP